MKTVLLLGGPADGQRVDVHGKMLAIEWSEILPFDGAVQPSGKTHRYQVVPMCSHGEVHWFGVLDGADPLALLIAGYAGHQKLVERGDKSVNQVRAELHARADALVQSHTFDPATRGDIVWAPKPAVTGVGLRPPSPYGTGGVKEGDDR